MTQAAESVLDRQMAVRHILGPTEEIHGARREILELAGLSNDRVLAKTLTEVAERIEVALTQLDRLFEGRRA